MPAEELLPAWVRIAPWLVGPVYGLLAALAVAVALRLVPKPPADPWTERARGVMPARLLALTGRLSFGICAAVFAAFLSPSLEHLVRDSWTVAWAFFGAVVPALRWEDRLEGRSSPVPGLRSFAARAVNFYLVIPAIAAPALLNGLGPVIEWGSVLASLVAFAWLMRGGGLTVGRLLGLVRPARPKVRAAVERAAARMNVRVRRVLELDWLFANAFALPLAGDIAFTRPMEDLMPDDELEAVASHELGHLSEPLRIKLARPLSVLALYATLVGFFKVGSYTIEAAVVLFALIVTVIIVLARVGRAAERHADAAAHGDGPAFGRALERIYAFNHVPAVLRRAGAHGHLYDRMVAAGCTPSWPRPAPPPRAPLRARLLVVALAFAPVAWVAGFLPEPRTETDALLALAAGRRSSYAWEELGRAAIDGGDTARAIVFYEAAVDTEPADPFLRSALSLAYARGGRCDEARGVYQAAFAMASEVDSDLLRDATDAARAELQARCPEVQ